MAGCAQLSTRAAPGSLMSFDEDSCHYRVFAVHTFEPQYLSLHVWGEQNA